MSLVQYGLTAEEYEENVRKILGLFSETCAILRKKGDGKMQKKKKTALKLAAAGVLIFLLLGLDTRLVVRRYKVESEKLTASMRIVFLSDLHSCDYGEGQRELVDLALSQEPDLILLGGDWMDDDFGHRPPERAYQAARALAEYAPTFYVIGNHEMWSGYGSEIKEQIAACGVKVLSGEWVPIDQKGQSIRLCGIDDPMAGEEQWTTQVKSMRAAAAQGGQFSILLTHRPERVAEYDGFDLVLAGHAHGGQWRLPKLLNGLFAPDQGLFPQYAGGMYSLPAGGAMLVGRGLSRETTRVPRFYNRPEVVVVDILPKIP